MLICNDVVKRYSSCIAVDHVNLSIEDGKVYALLGPNGSGKTTLMKMMMGLTMPTSGMITLDNMPYTKETKADIVYMPTENYFYPYMKIKDVVKFQKDFYPDFSEEEFERLLVKMELNFSDKVKNMSTGMLAKLKIAVAMARKSRIIMLDEPLNGIDIIARGVIVDAIISGAGSGRTIIVSSHLVDELETIVDGAFFIKNGKLIGSVDKDTLKQQDKSLVELYKEIYGHEGGAFNA